jgi:hypothetical protein
MNSAICAAIRERKTLELRYNGYSRLVEPYAYGASANDEDLLRCYQMSGGSNSGETTGWKLLKTADIYMLQATTSTFECRREYRRGDKAMDRIYCQL